MPAKKPPPPDTLGHLAEAAQQVYVVCGKCGHFAPIKCYDLAKRFGWQARSAQIAQKLRCSECGTKRASLTTQRPRLGRALCPRCLRPLG